MLIILNNTETGCGTKTGAGPKDDEILNGDLRIIGIDTPLPVLRSGSSTVPFDKFSKTGQRMFVGQAFSGSQPVPGTVSDPRPVVQKMSGTRPVAPEVATEHQSFVSRSNLRPVLTWTGTQPIGIAPFRAQLPSLMRDESEMITVAPPAPPPAAVDIPVVDPSNSGGPRAAYISLATPPSNERICGDASAGGMTPGTTTQPSSNAAVVPAYSSHTTFVFRGQDGNPTRKRSFSQCHTVHELFMHARRGGLLLSKAPILPILALKIQGSQKELEVGVNDKPDFADVVDAIRRDRNRGGEVVVDVRLAEPWHSAD